MSALSVTLQSGARAVAIVAMVLPLAAAAAVLVRERRSLWWPLVLAVVFVMPSLVVAYSWGTVSWSPVHSPLGREILYLILRVAQLLPVAVVGLLLVPVTAADRQAWFQLRRLAPHAGLRLQLRCWWAAYARSGMVAAGLVFMLAFAEFEIASLFVIDAWAVWCFDALATGVPVGSVLASAWPGMALQLLVVIAVVVALRRPRGGELGYVSSAAWLHWCGRLAITVAALAVVVVPAWVVLQGAFGSWQVQAVGSEIMTSMLLAAGVSACVVPVVAVVMHLPSRWRRSVTLAMLIPGLLGSLGIGVLVLQGTQWPLLRPFASGYAPVLIALCLVVAPLAAVAALGLLRMDAVALFQHQRQAWGQWQRGLRLFAPAYAAVAAVVFVIAYLDLPSAALLAPLDQPPVTARLYNLMHYGRTAALSSMVAFALLPPLACGLLGAGVWAAWWRRA
ncbi:MAG: hypothetical protein PF961_16085 [Planctomycetota bacterium]|jgi:ABC-type Fe3+ transport system permease subunit|nr:hypothetical protein [Planctomycetota bacterium]